ncbi:cell wall hydrolase [Methylobacterium sp. A54F]
MAVIRGTTTIAVLSLIGALPGLAACSPHMNADLTTGSIPHKSLAAATEADRECLARAMYFESKRSDSDGLLAVGTVVMNRLEAAAFPDRICAVVGQPRQFAAGVLTKPMREQDLPRLAEVADAVLAGERHPKVGRAMYFHTAGRRYPYDNMHYVALAGGNAFYEKRGRDARTPAAEPAAAAPVQVAALAAAPEVAAAQTILNEPARDICRVGA